MMSDYREHYIYQLKKDNQVLWGELQELPMAAWLTNESEEKLKRTTPKYQ